MEINVNDNSKTVEIWLSSQEKQDAALREQLRPLYRAYTEKKYLVAVFQSGERDLRQSTSGLREATNAYKQAAAIAAAILLQRP